MSGPAIVTQADAMRVLVVDDNTSLLRFLVSAFTANGCNVAQASAAEQAIELLSGEAFDLVVSDIKMPGLSGLDLLRAVKGKQPGTPFVLITGAPSLNSAVFGLRHGAYDYLPKPFSIKEIQDLVARIRADRARWNGPVGVPAGLAEELARRQFGVETLFHIGELALQGLEPWVFVEKVLDSTVQSIRCDGALILLRDEQGNFTSSQHGDATLVGYMLRMLQVSFEGLIAGGGMAPIRLTEGGQSVEALAALVPGIGRSMGILALARKVEHGGFLPDERELLQGYAQATEVALAMSLPPDTVQVVARGAMLHDLGKLSIMDSILRKPGRLTPEEFALIKQHPVIGDNILKLLRFLQRESCAVRHHHERFDGAGYPDGLKGEDIPLVARVVTVADVFDAITSNRPYRTALPLEFGREEVARGRSSHFDPVAAEAFATIPLARLSEINRHYESLTSPSLWPEEPTPRTLVGTD